jgi:hypothetical protein
MRTSASSVLVMLLLCLVPAVAPAAGNITLGTTEVHPYVSVKEDFSDNIFYTSTDERSDSITTITPGIRLVHPFRAHAAELEYYAVVNRYSKYRTEDTTDNFANGKVDLKFGSLFGLRLTDAYTQSHEPRASSSTGFIEEYRSNAAGLSATYQLADRSKVQVDYGRTDWRYLTSSFRNRDEDLVSGYFFYRFLPKTSVFVEYDFKKVSFVDGSLELDNTVGSALLGLTWEMSESSKGTVKAGTLAKDFSDKAKGSVSTWTGAVDVRHAFSERTAVTLGGSRVVNETSLLGNRYYITTGLSAELTHRFLSKLTGALRGTYGTDDYADALAAGEDARRDRTTTAGAGVTYKMHDWISLGLDYGLKDRRSNQSANDYTEHSTLLSVNIAL